MFLPRYYLRASFVWTFGLEHLVLVQRNWSTYFC